MGKAGFTTIPDAVTGIGNWLLPDGEVFVIAPPSVTVGSELAADPPTWTAPGNPSYTLHYQWYREDLDHEILGATGDTYITTIADQGSNVFVRVNPTAPFYYAGLASFKRSADVFVN